MNATIEAPTRAVTPLQVCQDVLDRLDEGRLTVCTGSYFKSEALDIDSQATPDEVERLCEVCAIGAATLSHLRLRGEDEPRHMTEYNGVRHEGLGESLGFDNAGLIESAFERSPFFAPFDKSSAKFRAILFGSLFSDPRRRLRAIMVNCVAHNGQFRPFVPKWVGRWTAARS